MNNDKNKNIIIAFLLVIAISLLGVLLYVYSNKKNTVDTSKHEELIKNAIKGTEKLELINIDDNKNAYYIVSGSNPVTEGVNDLLEVVYVNGDFVKEVVDLSYITMSSFSDASYSKYKISDNVLYFVTNGCGVASLEEYKAGTEVSVTFKDGKATNVKSTGNIYKEGAGAKC